MQALNSVVLYKQIFICSSNLYMMLVQDQESEWSVHFAALFCDTAYVCHASLLVMDRPIDNKYDN